VYHLAAPGEIGVRAALGADARRILTGILSRATWQLGLGIAVGLLAALVLERYSGGEMMGGRGLVIVPGIAAFMAVVGLLAAAGPARTRSPRTADRGAAGGVAARDSPARALTAAERSAAPALMARRYGAATVT
jgi:hypothetical protein